MTYGATSWSDQMVIRPTVFFDRKASVMGMGTLTPGHQQLAPQTAEPSSLSHSGLIRSAHDDPSALQQASQKWIKTMEIEEKSEITYAPLPRFRWKAHKR
ncbi:hypothetical protein HMPREF1531_00608 [Propionibacterium sp. oral taxon 192 str. F0372]|nr:hypothetical protein HMPREF1531_00608 [Propionibacterium sp. oral taxon 192 str. F0372]